VTVSSHLALLQAALMAIMKKPELSTLTVQQLLVLHTVYRNRGVHTTRTLSETIGSISSSPHLVNLDLAHAIADLADRGLIERDQRPEDGRSMLVVRTDKGFALLDSIIWEMTEANTAADLAQRARDATTFTLPGSGTPVLDARNRVTGPTR